jgi:hypothetical protein
MSNNKQQTAVEWLMDNVYIDPNPELYAKFQQAKEMEKEQTLKFGIQCQLDFIKSDGIRTVDDIYEQTYGGNK